MAYTWCHELLHLIIPPRDVGGKRSAHPPEFWEAERTMSPDRSLAWTWIAVVLHSCLRRDNQRECMMVKPTWKRLTNLNRPTLDELQSILHPRQGKLTEVEGHML